MLKALQNEQTELALPSATSSVAQILNLDCWDYIYSHQISKMQNFATPGENNNREAVFNVKITTFNLCNHKPHHICELHFI